MTTLNEPISVTSTKLQGWINARINNPMSGQAIRYWCRSRNIGTTDEATNRTFLTNADKQSLLLLLIEHQARKASIKTRGAEIRHPRRKRTKPLPTPRKPALTDEQIIEIRKMRAQGQKLREIAAAFQVSHNHIHRIVNNKIRLLEPQGTQVMDKSQTTSLTYGSL